MIQYKPFQPNTPAEIGLFGLGRIYGLGESGVQLRPSVDVANTLFPPAKKYDPLKATDWHGLPKKTVCDGSDADQVCPSAEYDNVLPPDAPHATNTPFPQTRTAQFVRIVPDDCVQESPLSIEYARTTPDQIGRAHV